ncbi:MAG TPA: hypothetical protein VIQ31_40500 [Phormidium sp.]
MFLFRIVSMCKENFTMDLRKLPNVWEQLLWLNKVKINCINMRQLEAKPKVSVDSILERIFAIRQINRSDQHILMAALLSKDSLNEKDQRQINQVYEAIQKGLIRVVD